MAITVSGDTTATSRHGVPSPGSSRRGIDILWGAASMPRAAVKPTIHYHAQVTDSLVFYSLASLIRQYQLRQERGYQLRVAVSLSGSPSR